MKLNHNESSSSVRHLGKCYFRGTLLNCVMAKCHLVCWNWTLMFCSFYSIITMSLQAIWSFSDSSCDSWLSPRRKGYLTCFPLPNLCPSKPHLAWLLSYWLPISPLHCLLKMLFHCQYIPLYTPHQVLFFLLRPFILVNDSTLLLLSESSHWLFPLTYHPLHVSHQLLLILDLSNLTSS